MSQATLKQRVNMVVMRMIAQNSDHDQRTQINSAEQLGSRGQYQVHYFSGDKPGLCAPEYLIFYYKYALIQGKLFYFMTD